MDPTAGAVRAILQTAAADPSVIFCLDPDLRIVYCNPAWDRFALKNGGDDWIRSKVAGRPILDYISGQLREYYHQAYMRVFESGGSWQHEYECSSASEFRLFSMRVLSLPDRDGLLCINSLRVNGEHRLESCVGVEDWYRDPAGQVTLCSNCRRTKRPISEESWEWVPAFVDNPPQRVTHGLCSMCAAYYYAHR